VNYLLRLALNCDPPDLCFLSSLDYRCEPLVPGSNIFLLEANLNELKVGERVDLNIFGR
jgi:hypothetical protein